MSYTARQNKLHYKCSEDLQLTTKINYYLLYIYTKHVQAYLIITKFAK